MKTSTKQILKVMNVLSWIIFIGCCIKTGSILYSFFVSLFINQEAAKNLYLELNLSTLKEFDVVYYSVMMVLVIGMWTLKALMFYFVVKIFSKINFEQPFSAYVALLIKRISSVAVIIGLLGLIATKLSEGLLMRGVTLSNLSEFIGGGGEFLFFAGIIYIISLVFKRGIEIQSENELTV